MPITTSGTLHQALAITTISLNQLHVGIGDGWTAPTLQKLRNPGHELYLSIEDSSWIASAEHIGHIFGSFIPVLLLDIVGRKAVIASCSVLLFLVWLGITFSTSVLLMCWMRFVFGVACGINTGTDTIYLAEVTSPSLRGIFGTIVLSLYYLGMLVEYAAATYLSYRHTAVLNTVLGLLAIVSVYWTVESPQLLLLKGKDIQAERNLLYLKATSDPKSIRSEFDRMKQNVEFERTKKTSYKTVLTSTANYKSVLIVVLLQTLCDATGYMPVLSFSSLIFSSTEMFTQNELTILLGLSQFVIGFFALLVIDRYSRRSLLLVMFSLATLMQFCTAALFYTNDRIAEVPHFPWLIFITINAYIGILAIAYPAIFTLRGELFPLSVKALGGCAVTLCNSLSNFVINMVFLNISRSYGMHMNFLIYSVVGVVFVVFLYFCVPETRNKSLTEIQDDLHKRD